MEERLITADDLVRGGCCWDGVMQSASEEWPAAFPVSAAVREARRRRETQNVMRAIGGDGYGDGYGDGSGDGSGDGYGDGSGDGYGDGDGDGGGGGGGYLIS